MIYKIIADSFEPKDVFDCGQCFRWNKEDNDSYTGIFHNCVLNVEKKDNEIIFNDMNTYKEKCNYKIDKSKRDIENLNKAITKSDIKNYSENYERMLKEYFDLDRDYTKIKNTLSNVDEYLKNSIEYGKGIRILNQDLWETIISFIISANNNIPRIKGIIERISAKYGTCIEANGKKYFTFPTPNELSKASVQDLRQLGLGFRDVRVFETTRIIANNEIDLKKLYKMPTEDVRNILLTLPGVGPKVADCILLFSDLKRFDVFPIDVWVRRVMNELYIKNPDEEKVNKKEIRKLADEKFGNLEGIAQQYLFYWKREA